MFIYYFRKLSTQSHTASSMANVKCLVGMQCLPAAQGPVAWDVFHTAAIRDHTLLLQQVIKVNSIKFGEAILLGDVDLKRNKKEEKNRRKF